VTSETIPAEYQRFVDRQRRDNNVAEGEPLTPGETGEEVRLDREALTRLAPIAAARAAGFFRPTTRTEIVWVDGDSELAVIIAEVRAELGDGTIVVTVPVRCDQTGTVKIFCTFSLGSKDAPAGLFAATERVPRGPTVITDLWGEALVAFAWQVVLGLVSDLAGATGKDARGNRLIPVALTAGSDVLGILPMARHRFGPTTTLSSGRPPSSAKRRGAQR
jgi:hypothetical protein